ncbi:MAG: hypothetical protein IT335_04755 [Thermomicrobiales bacterium]|nr:hypothetical protein [Thermomicrobiales bacterium]
MTNERNTNWFDETGHLTREGFDALIDRDDAAVEADVRTHLTACATCREHLAELQVTVNLLGALPDPVPGRSFQIEVPKPAPAAPPPIVDGNPGIGGRLRSVLMPALPALRAATLGVFLLFVAATAGDQWTGRNGNESTRDSAPAASTILSTEVATFPAETESLEVDGDTSTNRSAVTDAAASDQEEEAPPALGSGAESTESEAAADSAAFDSAPAAAMPQEAQVSATGPAGLLQETVSATVAPATPLPPSPTATPVVESGDDGAAQADSWSGWQVAQAILLALLGLLLVTLLWLRWSNRRKL